MDALDVLYNLFGWVSFAAWSISFYPQVILNYQRKIVDGLSFDFLLLNFVGFACYTANVCLLYCGHCEIPINDVAFAVHALAMCFVVGVQAVWYPKGGNPGLRMWCKVTTALIVVSIALNTGLAATSLSLPHTSGSKHAHRLGNYEWPVAWLSYIKEFITFIKYAPQAWMNFRRKSTVGWSIHNILLDFTGGILSLSQLVVSCKRDNSWQPLVGNQIKLILALFSVLFDVLFFVQHYCLYPAGEHANARVLGANVSDVEGRPSTSGKEREKRASRLPHMAQGESRSRLLE